MSQPPAPNPRAATPSAADAPRFRALLFTKTAGYRHESIANGATTIAALGAAHAFTVDATEDAGVFEDTQLAAYRVVIFFNTSGDVLDERQQAAMERFVRAGGGFVGIHSATDTEYDWPWYHQLIGAYFQNHPAIQPAAIDVVDQQHPSTRHLPARWQRTDEWYNFRAAPGPDVSILAMLDESSYTGGTMGAAHPIAWCHSFDGGRAWYTALGHTAESYDDPLFQQHVLGGITWASGLPEQSSTAYLPNSGERIKYWR